MKIYTKTGDLGNTTINGKKVPKYDYRIKCVGALDELNSYIGYINSILLLDILFTIQHALFDIGSCIHNPEKLPKAEEKLDELTTRLENEIDIITQTFSPLTQFILPSGGKIACFIHIVRTVCRKTERTLVKYFANEDIPDFNIVKFINRLSDYFFSLARLHYPQHIVYKSVLF